MRRTLLALSLLACAGCATAPQTLTAPAWTKLGPPPYRVGPYTVQIAPQAEVERVCRAAHAPIKAGEEFRGCYLGAPYRALWATEDVWALLHEFRHALDPAWKHD